MSRVVIIPSGTAAGPKVQVSGCPRCRRPIRLDHAGGMDGEDEVVDLAVIAFAQQLHLSQCSG